MAVSLWPHFFGPSCTYLENTPKNSYGSVSQVGVLSKKHFIETPERIVLGFGVELPSTYPTLCYEKIRVPPKIKYIPLHLCPKFRTGKNLLRHIDRRNLARQRQTLSVINWTVNGQLSWQYLRRSTASLSQLSSGSVYSTIPSRGSICNSWLSTLIIFGRITISSPQ